MDKLKTLEEIIEELKISQSQEALILKGILIGQGFVDFFSQGIVNGRQEFTEVLKNIFNRAEQQHINKEAEYTLEILAKKFSINYEKQNFTELTKFMEKLGDFLYQPLDNNIIGFQARNKEILKTLFSSNSLNKILPDFFEYAYNNSKVAETENFVRENINMSSLKIALGRKKSTALIKNIPIEKQQQIYYFMFANRIKTVVECALEYFKNQNENKNLEETELVRKIIKSEKLKNEFKYSSPFSSDLPLTDKNGKYAPRLRNSVIFMLEFYSNYFNKKIIRPNGEIGLWESPNTPIWKMGETSKEIFFDMINVHNEFYIISSNQLKNMKIKTAIYTLFRGSCEKANKQHLQDNLGLTEQEIKKIHLLKYVTDNDTSILNTAKIQNKKEIIKTHFEILEEIIKNANLNEQEQNLLQEIYKSKQNTFELNEKEYESQEYGNKKHVHKDAFNILKGKILISAIAKYRNSFEQGIKQKTILEQEKRMIHEKKPLVLDRYYRLRLANRLNIDAQEQGLNIDQYYKKIAFFSDYRKPKYLSKYQFELFNKSKQEMFEFAFGRPFK